MAPTRVAILTTGSLDIADICSCFSDVFYVKVVSLNNALD